MIVYGKEILEAFVTKHAISKKAVDRWLKAIEEISKISIINI